MRVIANEFSEVPEVSPKRGVYHGTGLVFLGI